MKFLRTIFLLLALAPDCLRAQMPPQISPAAAAQAIMHPQPPVDDSQLEKVSATAEFDPPAVPPGGKTFYRVTINATQNSIRWPDKISAPTELEFGAGARGQLMQPDGTPFLPHTEFVYEITAPVAGHFAVSNFLVSVGGRDVEIPAADLTVQTNAVPLPPRKLFLWLSRTNLFFGQPFLMRVILPAARGGQIDALRDVQFNGNGFLADKLSTRQSVQTVKISGQESTAYIYETTATPMAAGMLAISAQGFTSGLLSAGPITIRGGGPVVIRSGPPKYALLLSGTVNVNVHPLPEENELPGFTGAMGKFLADAPLLSTNRLHVGEPVKLKYNFHGEENLTRFVPPAAPRSREWQIIAGRPGENIFTLIPLTDETSETPAIPFSAFDPATGNYYDLTIPAQPVTVIGNRLPAQIAAWNGGETNAAPLRLGELSRLPGKTVASLKPLQLQGWFVAGQMLPVLFLIALWRWDEHRRFLKAHPEIARRRKAKRDLHREKNLLRRAMAAGEAEKILQHAVAAMRIAVAPHFPADSRALVGGDVLSQLEPPEQNGKTGETVRKIFAAADAKFSNSKLPPSDLLALKAEVEIVLERLEEKL